MLPQYRGVRVRPVSRAVLLVILVLFCFLDGFAFALLAPAFILPFAIPPLLLLALCFWAMPDSGPPPDRTLTFFFYAFLIVIAVWPNYLAVAIPGLPRLTVMRLVGIPFTFLMLAAMGGARLFLAELGRGFKAAPLFAGAILSFYGIQILSVAFSKEIGESINVLANVSMNWMVAFLVCAFLCLYRPNNIKRMAGFLCGMAITVCALGLWEYRIGQLPWAGHLPSFLKVDDPIVERILAGLSRGGKGRRVQGPFSTSLGLSEFLALCFPFFLHYAVVARRLVVRIMSIGMVPVLLVVVLLTQARLGLVGMFVAALLFPGCYILLTWWRNPKHPAAATALIMAPFGAALAAAVAFLTPGIRIRMLGGGVEQLSTQARYDQMHMGMPKILSHPWGYGIGRGADTLGYRNAEGFLTIDSYSLRLALEYGVVGFALYYAMFLFAIFYSAKTLSKARELTEELRLLIPLSVAFASYLVMRTVFAQEDNQALMYCLFGVVVGIVAGAKVQAKAGPSTN